VVLFRHVRLYLMKGVWWPVFEKLQFVDDITHKQIIDFSSLFRSHLTLDMLVAGNMTAEVIQFFMLLSNFSNILMLNSIFVVAF
jgi:secreted Zn-dependent insulinase-like peptidase